MERSNKMEFFQKLGYSREDVVRVLDKLGEGALVNDILQELIQMGSRHGPREASTVPLLVPRGSCGTLDSAQHRLRMDLEEECGNPASLLRPIVIDGSNVAMSHGNKEAFSCRGIQLAVDWFRDRGHTYIKVFVPSWRKEPPRSDTPIREQHVLEELERQAVLVYTPSRKVSGRRVVCYDDRYIVKVAIAQDGVIVSNDNYRDLQSENPEWKWFIQQRLLMFSFVNDRFMPPDDPLGRRGPTLSNFLSKKPKPPEPSWQHCPYGKKCTYGIKCKFYHPERPRQTQLAVADELRAQTRAWRGAGGEPGRPRAGRDPAGREPGCSPAAAWPGPREPGAPSLPPARGAAAVAALEGRFSRLQFGDHPGLLAAPPSGAGCRLAPGPLRPDWAAPAAPPSPASGSGLQGGYRPGDAQDDLRPQARQPDHPWAPAEGPGGFPPRPAAWADSGWAHRALRGPSTVEAQEGGARAPPHAARRSLFAPHQADGVLTPGPAFCSARSPGPSCCGDAKGLARPWESPKE